MSEEEKKAKIELLNIPRLSVKRQNSRDIILKAIDKKDKEIEKLQKENEHRKEVLINTLKENEQLSFDIDDKIKIIDKLQKENAELKEKLKEYEIGIVKE